MNDYSEVTCHLQRDVVNLINALNDKKWADAFKILVQMQKDIFELSLYCMDKENEQ
ncbi:MAG TPA: hypothetical protein VFM18_10410 [Methanosarcina sp.]|nr:hypothetical protein [Methanosarcina sp.]